MKSSTWKLWHRAATLAVIAAWGVLAVACATAGAKDQKEAAAMEQRLSSGVSNEPGKDGVTPLHVAAYRGQVAAVQRLLEHGAPANVRDNFGSTPLHLASLSNHRDVAELLITRGADVNARDNTLWTPLAIAAVNGHREMVDFLLGKGASLENAGGPMPLHGAAFAGKTDMVTYLLSKRANPNIVDVQGKTALDYAIAKENRDVIKVLRDSGAKTAREMNAPAAQTK